MAETILLKYMVANITDRIKLNREHNPLIRSLVEVNNVCLGNPLGLPYSIIEQTERYMHYFSPRFAETFICMRKSQRGPQCVG